MKRATIIATSMSVTIATVVLFTVFMVNRQNLTTESNDEASTLLENSTSTNIETSEIEKQRLEEGFNERKLNSTEDTLTTTSEYPQTASSVVTSTPTASLEGTPTPTASPTASSEETYTPTAPSVTPEESEMMNDPVSTSAEIVMPSILDSLISDILEKLI